MRLVLGLVILEVLSNPLLWGWGHSGGFDSRFFPSSGEFDTMICQIPCIPRPSPGVGGMKLTSELETTFSANQISVSNL